MIRDIKRAWHWIVLLLSADAVFVFATWIIRQEAIKYMSLFILLFTLFILIIGFAAEFYRQRKDEAALLNFLEMPENRTKEILLERFGNSEAIRALCTQFLMDDYAMEVLNEFLMFMKEKNISLDLDLEQSEVVSDRKIVSFMLSQLIGNAVKYADSRDGKISLSLHHNKDKIRLAIYNNGEGVPPEDAPFIFDKGFTGNYPNRQKATGMRLYLVRKYAEKLCAEVTLVSHIPFENGFGIELVFVL